jgi:hypothetical protein
MGDQGAPRARRVPVDSDEPLIGSDQYDYADAFEIRLREPDARSAEQFARCALEQLPLPVRWTIRIAHRHALRLRLGPRSSPDHLLGWKILTSRPEVLHLEAVSPLLGRGVLVARKVDPTRVVLTTYLFHTRRPAPARVVWNIAGPLHRRIAPYLLERAAATANRGEHPAALRMRILNAAHRVIRWSDRSTTLPGG